MRNLTFVVFLLTGLISSSIAQEREIGSAFGIGGHLNQYQSDFGLGLNLTSPYFANERMALRLRTNIMWNEHVMNSETTWTPYSNVLLGFIGGRSKVGASIRLYSEGGVIGVFPSDEFSSESLVLGGYGFFGFEFFMSSHSNYFIEIGAVGTGAKADKNINKPIYSNGLTISTGYRLQF